MKACIVTIALLACAAQDAVPALKFQSTDGTTCLLKKDGSDIVGACGSDAFKSIISGDTVVQDQRISTLEANVNSLLENTPCRPGYHKTAINPFESEADAHTAVCVPCVGHTFNGEITYETACTPCATGYAPIIGHDHTSCDVCAAGYGEVSSAETCDVCEADFFSTNENTQAIVPCSACSDNTHTNGTTAQGACTMCAAGFGRSGYDAMGHATCVACVPGSTYSTADMLSCDLLSTCAVGKGVVPGTVFSTTSVTTSYCEDCSSDTEYSDEDSLSSCQSCPTNTHTTTAQGACTMCAAGFGRSGYDAMGHATCVACVPGSTYSTADMLSCDLLPTCAVGKGVVPGTVFSTTSVATSYCEDCSSDTEYSDEDSLSSCQTHSSCPAGEGVVNALNEVSDTSHRDCEICPSDKYSASSVFAQCYTFAAAKYTKTGPATFPLACAANHYRVDANEIEYDSSTGAMSNDVCTSCGTCAVPTKTACDATSPTVCCTTKPPLSAYSASAGAIPDPTCAFTCDDPNAEVGPTADSCECETGWERGSDSVLCTETPVDTWTMHPSQGCQEVGRYTESGITLEQAKEICRDYVTGGLYQGNVITQSCVSIEEMPTGEFLFSTSCTPSVSASSVEPSNEDECTAAAQAAGLSLGGAGYDFVGPYYRDGCYTYAANIPAYYGMAFWSTGSHYGYVGLVGALRVWYTESGIYPRADHDLYVIDRAL